MIVAAAACFTIAFLQETRLLGRLMPPLQLPVNVVLCVVGWGGAGNLRWIIHRRAERRLSIAAKAMTS